MLVKKGTPPFYTQIMTPRKYRALLTQTGTNAPIATVIQTDMDVSWIYGGDVGTFYAYFADSATTINTIQFTNTAANVIVSGNYDPIADAMIVFNYSPSSGAVNGTWVDMYVEITQYQILT